MQECWILHMYIYIKKCINLLWISDISYFILLTVLASTYDDLIRTIGVVQLTVSSEGSVNAGTEAIDNSPSPGAYNEWAARSEIHGVWIRIVLAQVVHIKSVIWWPRCYMCDQFGRVIMDTGSGPTQTVTDPECLVVFIWIFMSHSYTPSVWYTVLPGVPAIQFIHNYDWYLLYLHLYDMLFISSTMSLTDINWIYNLAFL